MNSIDFSGACAGDQLGDGYKIGLISLGVKN